jgi:hypothetical protein
MALNRDDCQRKYLGPFGPATGLSKTVLLKALSSNVGMGIGRKSVLLDLD